MTAAAQVPLWVPLVVGLLAVLGTVGGALGAQFVAGRNELRRLESERTQQNQQYWRDKRLATYSRYLSMAIEVVIFCQDRLRGDRTATVEPLYELTKTAKIELEAIRMLGERRTVEHADAVMRLMGRSTGALLDPNAKDDEFEQYLVLMDQQIFDMMSAFRSELGLTLPQSSDP